MRSAFTEHYESRRDMWSQDSGMRESTSLLLSAVAPGSHILDIGCGAGIDALQMAERGHQVTALDLVESRRWREWKDPNVRFYHGAFQDFSSPKPFDAILDNGCFHHQTPEDVDSYLTKAAALLSTGGWLCLNVYTPREEGRDGVVVTLADGRFAAVFNVNQLRNLVGRHGLTLADARRVNSSTHGGKYLIALFTKD